MRYEYNLLEYCWVWRSMTISLFIWMAFWTDVNAIHRSLALQYRITYTRVSGTVRSPYSWLLEGSAFQIKHNTSAENICRSHKPQHPGCKSQPSLVACSLIFTVLKYHNAWTAMVGRIHCGQEWRYSSSMSANRPQRCKSIFQVGNWNLQS
jgi:hypothetical protein